MINLRCPVRVGQEATRRVAQMAVKGEVMLMHESKRDIHRSVQTNEVIGKKLKEFGLSVRAENSACISQIFDMQGRGKFRGITPDQ